MLAVVRDANHLTIVDSDGEAGGTKLAEEYFSRFLEFPKVSLHSHISLFYLLLLPSPAKHASDLTRLALAPPPLLFCLLPPGGFEARWHPAHNRVLR